jgi:hypothetical protein
MTTSLAPAAADLPKLIKQRARLQASLDRANEKETERFAKLTWGYGMRHSKLPNTSARVTDLEYRLDRLDRQIKKLSA